MLPLRRILPAAGRVDTASLVALLVVQLVATLLLFRVRTASSIPFVSLCDRLRSRTRAAALLLYTILIFVYAALSFIAPGVRSPATALLAALCEPVLRPLRRVLPVVGGIDFSPLVAILGLTALRILIH